MELRNIKMANAVEPLYNEVLGTMKITLLYQVSRYIRVKNQRNIKSWDQQNDLVIRGFCYIRPLYNEVPLYCGNNKEMSEIISKVQEIRETTISRKKNFNVLFMTKPYSKDCLDRIENCLLTNVSCKLL